MSPETYATLEVRVQDYKGQPLPQARVSLLPAAQRRRSPALLQFDRQRRTHRTTGVTPGRYILRAEADGLEADQREVHVTAGAVTETFVLGKAGLPFYYRGRVKVPFDPPRDLLAVATRPKPTGAAEQELLTLARRLKLTPAPVPEAARDDSVRLFKLPPRTGERARQNLAQQLAAHPLVRLVGPVIHVDRDSVTFLTSQLVVRFKPHVEQDRVPGLAREHGLEVVRRIPYAPNGWLMQSPGPAGFELLEVCAKLAGRDDVEYAEPSLVTTAVDDYTPDDFLLAQQPHLDIIGAEAAWDITMGDSDIIIAVVDSGCDMDHPDFTNDAALGWTKVYQPYDFAGMDTDPLNSTHGTKSSGIATANADNAEGVAGVAPGCRLMPIRRPAGGADLDYADMYVWVAGFDPGSSTAGFPAAISPGADVISNSFGLSQAAISGVMQDALDFITTYGRGGKGCVVVFSVGNANTDFTTYRQWAADPKTIAVAASAISPPDTAEVKVSTSNFGNRVDVCAPGGGAAGGTESRTMSCTNVGSGDTAGTATATSNDYDDFGQTSCACPQVAGLAGLMLSINPELTWVEVRQIIRDTAVQIDAANTDATGQWTDTDSDGVADYSQWYGNGRIDAAAAVTGARDYGHTRDIVVRENLADVGAVASGGAFWNSPDIWVRNADPAADAAALPVAYGDAGPHQSPIAGQDNWVYVRFKNVGTAPSYDFYIRAYITHFPGTEFTYPDSFVPTVRPSDPVPSPLEPGTYLIGEASYSALAAGGVDTVSILWPRDLVPPQEVTVGGATVSWHPCLLVEISPHDGPAPTGNHVWDNNNLAQKNISIVYPDDESDDFAAAAVVGNRANRSRFLELVLDRSQVPPQVQVYVELADGAVRERLRAWLAGREPGADGREPEVEAGGCRFTFLTETRVLVDGPRGCGGGQAVLTLPPKATLQLAGPAHRPGARRYGFTPGHYQGREVLWAAPRGQTRIPVFAPPGTLVPVIVGGRLAGPVAPGAYEIRLIQHNPDGQPSGGVAVELRVR